MLVKTAASRQYDTSYFTGPDQTSVMPSSAPLSTTDYSTPVFSGIAKISCVATGQEKLL